MSQGEKSLRFMISERGHLVRRIKTGTPSAVRTVV